MQIEAIMSIGPVIPVIVIHDPARARPLAEALVRGGIRALEVTMRTPAALEAMQEMKKVPGAVIGAGTVLNARQLRQAKDAGAEFIVSPGLTQELGEAVIGSGLPFLPGVANAGDIMRGYDLGLRHFKFFPAETSGGINALRALAAPFYEAKFCPTGGVTFSSAPDWLALEPVLCVGGSWLIGTSLEEIELLAREAVSLKP